MIRNAIIAAILTGFASAAAHAQFVGDLFFESPSVNVTEGESIELIVQFFPGARVHGAVEFDVVYDALQLDVEAVALPGDTDYDILYNRTDGGTTSVIVVNDDDLTRPFGTESVARLTVTPLVSAGQQVSLVIEPRDALSADGAGFSSAQGFGATITVISPLASVSDDVQDVRQPGPVLVSHPVTGVDVPMRRPGAVIDAIVFDGRVDPDAALASTRDFKGPAKNRRSENGATSPGGGSAIVGVQPLRIATFEPGAESDLCDIDRMEQFLRLYADGDGRADFNGDGIIASDDIAAWIECVSGE